VVRAAELLDEVADESRLPDLYRLIQDDDWYIREVASIPLSRLDGVRALPLLFQALTRGRQEGHDNDLLGTMVVEVLEAHPEECAPLLLSMVDDSDPTVRAHGVCALGWQPAAVALAPLIAALRDCSRRRGCVAGLSRRPARNTSLASSPTRFQ
jgi:HEAT repeat protein